MPVPKTIKPFLLERYFAKYEFEAPYMLSSSDCETLSVADLLEMAGKSLADLGRLQLGYTESPGSPTLRATIAGLYDESIQPDDILIVVPEEGIFLAMWALLSAGDQVIVQTPCYQSLAELAQYHQAQVTPWSIQETDSGWQMDVNQLAELITPQTKLIILNTPHNPTGFHFSQSEFDQIINLAQQHDIWLFCDEMYRGAEYRLEDRLPSASERYPRAISLSGMSKTYGLPGLRIGWLASQDQVLIQRLQGLKDYTTICASAPSEFLAETALNIAPQLAQRSTALIQANLELVSDKMSQWQDRIAWRKPQAGPIAFVRYLPGNVDQMALDLVGSHGVMIAPAHTFGFGNDHFRLGLGRENFAEAFARFEQYLASKF